MNSTSEMMEKKGLEINFEYCELFKKIIKATHIIFTLFFTNQGYMQIWVAKLGTKLEIKNGLISTRFRGYKHENNFRPIGSIFKRVVHFS